jgi:ATP-dependent Clp protease adapter protein ClpS
VAISLPDIDILNDLGRQVDEIFDEAAKWAVIILDADTTTFEEVVRGCVEIFGYSNDNAWTLAWEVHTAGKAVAAILDKPEAVTAVEKLRSGNVKAKMELA